MPGVSSGVGGPCPEGYYCPIQTEDPIPCPNATYRDTLGGLLYKVLLKQLYFDSTFSFS